MSTAASTRWEPELAVRTVEYAAGGLLADLHGRADARATVLLWHGSGARERDVLGALAAAIADHDLLVVVPDWDCRAPDEGRAASLASLDLAEQQRPPLAVVVGWSLGAYEAVRLGVGLLSPDREVPQVVGLAGGFGDHPVRGPGLAVPPRGGARTRFVLAHGTSDDVVELHELAEGERRLRAAGWPVTTVELETDHAGIVGALLDPALGRCTPARPLAAPARTVVRLVAAAAER